MIEMKTLPPSVHALNMLVYTLSHVAYKYHHHVFLLLFLFFALSKTSDPITYTVTLLYDNMKSIKS